MSIEPLNLPRFVDGYFKTDDTLNALYHDIIRIENKINEIIALNSGAVGGEKFTCACCGKELLPQGEWSLCFECEVHNKDRVHPVENKPSDGLEEVIRYVLRDTAVALTMHRQALRLFASLHTALLLVV